jgi:hypothetical protein
MSRCQLTCLAALAALATLVARPALAGTPDSPGWQNGVWKGAGWEWQGGRGWAGNWRWRRGTYAGGWGSSYPGQGFYPWGYPYGNAWPYAPRGSYGCYHPVQVPGLAKWNFVREKVC